MAMRTFFDSVERPAQAARRIATSLGIEMGAAHDAVARSTGYLNWRDLMSCRADQPASPLTDTLSADRRRSAMATQIVRLALELNADIGDLQHVFSKSYLTFDKDWSLEDSLAIRCAAWELTGVIHHDPSRRGAFVEVDLPGAALNAGYQCADNDEEPWIIYDTTFGRCLHTEIKGPAIDVVPYVPTRLWLPYGYWTLKDGSQVIFSRDYFPLWRIADGEVERVDPWLRIEWSVETWFKPLDSSEWASGAPRQAALAKLEAHGITGLPRLADTLPCIIQNGRRRIHDGVADLRDTHA